VGVCDVTAVVEPSDPTGFEPDEFAQDARRNAPVHIAASILRLFTRLLILPP
jgi:hypothetical protein